MTRGNRFYFQGSIQSRDARGDLTADTGSGSIAVREAVRPGLR